MDDLELTSLPASGGYDTSAINPVLNKSLVRVDQNFAINSVAWFKEFGPYANLCLDILIYISHNAQRNLFNYGLIDHKDFCKKMGHNNANIQRITESLQGKKLSKALFDSLPRDKKFVTEFENALFLLGTHNIPYSYSTFNPLTDEKIVTTKFIQIFKEVNIHVSPSATRNIRYSYKTSEEFDYSISRFFFWSDFSVLPQMRKSNLRLLYFFLKNIESQGKYEFIEHNFANLCALAGISLPNPKDPDVSFENAYKLAKQHLINRKLKPLQQFLNYSFEPVKGSGKYFYSFKFTFHNNAPNKLDCFSNDTLRQQILADSQRDYIFTRLILFYRSNYCPYDGAMDKEDFKAWFVDMKKDWDEKELIYFNAIARSNEWTLEKVKHLMSRKVFEFYSCFPLE